jgi:hypothetical protein
MARKRKPSAATPRAKQAAKRKRARRASATTTKRARRNLQRSAAAEWHSHFGPLEALRTGEAAFRLETSASFRGARRRPRTRAAVPRGARVQALVGIRWTDPTFPIFYDIIVNGVPISPPNSAIGGKEIREVTLVRGQDNAIDWLIQHSSQGWHNKVFVKLDEQVFQLGEDSDESSADTDDLSTGMSNVPVP